MGMPSLQDGLGKYREIVVAVAFFLVFDMAVLILNFVISYQIADDALAINLAGRQRMLSQRMTKALLQVETAVLRNENPLKAIDELRQTVTVFSSTLQAFTYGGETVSAQGKPVELTKASEEKAMLALNSAYLLWTPYEKVLAPVLDGNVDHVSLQPAVTYATKHNVELLGLMNALTTALEQKAQNKADSLRLVQSAGIALALINFVFILFKFIRKLRDSDRLVEAARQETDAILATVREGLFLVDRRYHMGNQQSQSLADVLGRPCKPGMNFLDLLHLMVPPPVFIAARDFMELLIEGRVKEKLVADLNPLSEVAVRDPDGGVRYLSMQFNRAPDAHGNANLLVTVQDVTQRVQLEESLEAAKRSSRSDFDALLRLLRLNPALLAEFLSRTREILEDINHSLQQADRGNYRRLVEHIFRQVHTIKGDAGTLGLELFERLAHACERELLPLREVAEPNGEQLLVLLPHLDAFFERIDQVRELVGKVRREPVVEMPAVDLQQQLQQLALRVAANQHKRVRLECELGLYDHLAPGDRQAVRDLFVQLVRNAIVHGIESPEERECLGKEPSGLVRVAVSEVDGETCLEVRDDGAGINPRTVRSVLLSKGIYNEAQLEEMDDRQVVMRLFDPGVSTVTEADVDAGHGVGLDVVRQQIRRLGGHLKLASRPGAFTLFHVRLYA